MRRLLSISLFLVAGAGVSSAQSQSYELTAGTSFFEACFAPCVCLFTGIPQGDATGTFDLVPAGPVGSFDSYDILNIDWTITDTMGVTFPVVGDGAYFTNGAAGTEHQLILNVSIDGQPVASYDSGITAVVGAAFPMIDIAAALNAFFCYDNVWAIVAQPDIDATAYCTSEPNSSGAPALISATGSGSIGSNDLVLHVDSMPAGQPGIFYFGGTEAQIPFGNGFRCITGSTVRLFPIQMADGSGHMALAVDNTTLPGAFVPGVATKFQGWFRDPAGGGAGFDLSDGLSLVFAP